MRLRRANTWASPPRSRRGEGWWLNEAHAIRAEGSDLDRVNAFKDELGGYTFGSQNAEKHLYLTLIAAGASDEKALDVLNRTLPPS